MRHPFRRVAPAVAVVALALGTAALTPQTASGQEVTTTRIPAQHASTGECSGAAAMDKNNKCLLANSGSAVPWGAAATGDRASAYDQECVAGLPWAKAQYKVCIYDEGDSVANIALVGNSHAVHYLPTLLRLAHDNRWKVTTYFASLCFPTGGELAMPQPKRANCLAWGQWVQTATAGKAYDLVVTSNRTSVAQLGPEGAPRYPGWKDAFAKYLGTWLDGGANILVIRDNPFPGHTKTTVPKCLERHPDDFLACSAPRGKWLRADPQANAVLAAKSQRAAVADLTDLFCTTICFPVIGGTTVYRDHSHITATYARTLAAYLGPHVKAALAPDPAPKPAAEKVVKKSVPKKPAPEKTAPKEPDKKK